MDGLSKQQRQPRLGRDGLRCDVNGCAGDICSSGSGTCACYVERLAIQRGRQASSRHAVGNPGGERGAGLGRRVFSALTAQAGTRRPPWLRLDRYLLQISPRAARCAAGRGWDGTARTAGRRQRCGLSSAETQPRSGRDRVRRGDGSRGRPDSADPARRCREGDRRAKGPPRRSTRNARGGDSSVWLTASRPESPGRPLFCVSRRISLGAACRSAAPRPAPSRRANTAPENGCSGEKPNEAQRSPQKETKDTRYAASDGHRHSQPTPFRTGSANPSTVAVTNHPPATPRIDQPPPHLPIRTRSPKRPSATPPGKSLSPRRIPSSYLPPNARPSSAPLTCAWPASRAVDSFTPTHSSPALRLPPPAAENPRIPDSPQPAASSSRNAPSPTPRASPRRAALVAAVCPCSRRRLRPQASRPKQPQNSAPGHTQREQRGNPPNKKSPVLPPRMSKRPEKSHYVPPGRRTLNPRGVSASAAAAAAHHSPAVAAPRIAPPPPAPDPPSSSTPLRPSARRPAYISPAAAPRPAHSSRNSRSSRISPISPNSPPSTSNLPSPVGASPRPRPRPLQRPPPSSTTPTTPPRSSPPQPTTTSAAMRPAHPSPHMRSTVPRRDSYDVGIPPGPGHHRVEVCLPARVCSFAPSFLRFLLLPVILLPVVLLPVILPLPLHSPSPSPLPLSLSLSPSLPLPRHSPPPSPRCGAVSCAPRHCGALPSPPKRHRLSGHLPRPPCRPRIHTRARGAVQKKQKKH